MIFKSDVHKRVLAVKQALVAAGVLETSIQGCSKHEIETLEKRYDVRFPPSYRSFLAVMGKCAGPLMDDIEIFFDDVDGNIEEAKEILQLAETQIPETAFVFGCRLGDVFVFFDLSEFSDDPPVYRFTTGNPKYEKIWLSFTALLEENCDLTIKHLDWKRQK